MKNALFVLIVMLFLTSCLPKIGAVVQIKDNATKVVLDWNVPSSIKPVACYLNKGDDVTVLEYSKLFMGGSWSEEIVLVEHDTCKGWIFTQDIK